MNKRIMVVDDNPDILISIRKIFEKEGYEVFTVDSGMDCISEIERGFKVPPVVEAKRALIGLPCQGHFLGLQFSKRIFNPRKPPNLPQDQIGGRRGRHLPPSCGPEDTLRFLFDPSRESGIVGGDNLGHTVCKPQQTVMTLGKRLKSSHGQRSQIRYGPRSRSGIYGAMITSPLRWPGAAHANSRNRGTRS